MSNSSEEDIIDNPVYIEDILMPNRRISKTYFPFLLILIVLGPGFVYVGSTLIANILLQDKGAFDDRSNEIALLAEYIRLVLWLAYTYVSLVIFINRMRDTGLSLFWLFVPFVNIYLLITKKDK